MKQWFPILLSFALAGGVYANDKTVLIDDDRVSVALPPGWKESEQEQKGSDSIGGYESSDQKSSFFILEMKLQNQGDSIFRALESTIDNFDQNENWVVNKIGETKSVEVNGLPGAYARVELDLVSGERTVPFVFYFTIVGGRDSFFLLQGSNIKPVRTVREQEIFRMMRSFKVIKE